ncbi:metal ABC transporter substrate-binding protein [Aerococcus urinaehominis]|uniref:Lipoprotein n=1 Tax=Aerococcus urinaehominis TaxID=128944 RepID=A0A0X8FL16_9LACT|nr:MetQ/NlpA family ABC transporter substrate-binding protein [Aerococcus urinaehominis]AMB99286.1 metal ABC transporter substrate-binding protein [Aerococcus urinaehominis]SDM18986.1 D-methionine transport system substrate-binding protein [Aerococcus urinaehominis]
MKKLLKLSLLFATGLSLAACGGGRESGDSADQTVKLGIIGEDTDVWDSVKEDLAADGIELEYVKFTEYSQPNKALAEGDIDLNSFQHQIFLDNFNEEFGTDLVSIGNTVIAPLAIYSNQVQDIKEVKAGDTVAIPSDVTNGGRALILLQSAGLIKVDPAKGITPTVSDITENPLNLKITEVDASQTARSLGDVTISVINSGMAVDAGLNPESDAIFSEPVDENSKPYVNIIVARAEDQDNEVYQKVVDAYQTDKTAQAIQETSKGANVPAWEQFGRK